MTHNIAEISDIQLLWLAVTQGLSEFIPVSSSAHLVLFSHFFGFPDQGLAIDVAVHAGSLIAVMVYFRRRMGELCGGLYDTCRLIPSERAQLLFFLIIATLPIIPVGFLFSSLGSGFAEQSLRSPLVIAFATLAFALLLWHAERYGQTIIQFQPLSWQLALFVGAMQCFALIPGTSRAGVTTTACLFAGMRRKESLEIAMLLSVPVIIAATTLMLVKIYTAGDPILTRAFFLAAAIAAPCAYIAIALIMKFINKIGFLPFVLYRLALALWIIWIFRNIQ